MTVKDEEAVVQAFIKMYKDVTKTGDKLNASMLDQLQKMMKSATTMISNTKNIKANTTMSNKQLKFDEKELVVREKLKKADEHLIQLRHKLNIEQEREHGDQVRRNINLRKNMDSFNDKFDMLKKSITGGFGFQAAMDKTVKDMGKMTRTFQENRIAQVKYKKAQEMSADALFKMQMAFQTGDDADKQEAKTELELAKKAELRNEINVENTQEDMEKSGVAGRFKPMFAKLDQIGGFLGKKAVPIGIGMGVAGVLMSVIVKAFSASPLFAQMMKMMKFMVTLILMPIGTFFGALLRPILIVLLRKFIVPFYSTWMPKLMKWGNDIGKFIVDPLGWNKKKTTTTTDNTYDDIDDPNQNQASNWMGSMEGQGGFFPWLFKLINNGKTSTDTQSSNDTADPIDPDKNPYSWWWERDEWEAWEAAKKAEKIAGGAETVVMAPGSAALLTGTQLNVGSLPGGVSNDPYDSYLPEDHGQTSMNETEGERQVRLDKEERDRAALMESDQERTNRELAEAAAAEAERVAFEHADKANWMELNRSVLDMNKLMETNGIITEAIPKVMSQEMTNFAAYGMGGKTEKGGDIHDAGISMTQAEIDKLNAGYQGYGGLSSTVLEGSGGRSSQSVMDNYNAYLAGVVPAANGFNGMVNSPTMFLAGESGSEHVSITPSGGSGGGITVNIQNMNGSDNDLRKLKQTILEVIQQSSANRGRL
jgi:hypothetical protein